MSEIVCDSWIRDYDRVKDELYIYIYGMNRENTELSTRRSREGRDIKRVKYVR